MYIGLRVVVKENEFYRFIEKKRRWRFLSIYRRLQLVEKLTSSKVQKKCWN